MKISGLYLKNIKCFREIDISFKNGDTHQVKNWTLIAGNNGEGKTTLLRSLAIGLCDKEGASALLAELYGGFVRNGEKKGTIKVLLKNDSCDETEYTIETTITVGEDEYETLNQKIPPENQGLKIRDILAAGYGAGRTISGTNSYEEYALVDSLYNLFNYKSPLQNIELTMRRIKLHYKTQWKKLIEILKIILMLDDNDEINLEKTGLYVKRKRWGDIPFEALSDGYKSLTSVILDFLSWNLINVENFNLNNIQGIMIIDEIEQHLHPEWQREIIKALSEKFPKIQFICSTHTPHCILGLNDLKDTQNSQLLKTFPQNNHTEVKIFDLRSEYIGYRSDQILTSDIFNLSDTRSKNIEKKLERYREIYLKEKSNRTTSEKKELNRIKSELEDLPMWDNIKDEKQRKELIKLLKEKES